jgi:hypothetical protein
VSVVSLALLDAPQPRLRTALPMTSVFVVVLLILLLRLPLLVSFVLALVFGALCGGLIKLALRNRTDLHDDA